MNTEHYKAASERTDESERALIPPFKRKTIEQIDNDIARRKQRLTDTHKPMNTDTHADRAAYDLLERLNRTPNKAQHSRLPWLVGQSIGIIYDADKAEVCESSPMSDRQAEANARLIVASVNHADKLAEALREIRQLNRNRGKGKPIARACNRMDEVAEAALAEWEEAKQ